MKESKDLAVEYCKSMNYNLSSLEADTAIDAYVSGYQQARKDIQKWATELRDMAEANFRKNPCADLDAKIIVWNIIIGKLYDK